LSGSGPEGPGAGEKIIAPHAKKPLAVLFCELRPPANAHSPSSRFAPEPGRIGLIRDGENSVDANWSTELFRPLLVTLLLVEENFAEAALRHFSSPIAKFVCAAAVIDTVN
jgi:hypothetical protein